jgi:phosphopantothenoylcysteine synthetase/decarboxylase
MRKKNVLLGVAGSIASYKAAEIASRLTQAGFKAELATVMMRPEAETELEGGQAESMQKRLEEQTLLLGILSLL